MRCQYLESTELKKKSTDLSQKWCKRTVCVRNWHTKISESEGESA